VCRAPDLPEAALAVTTDPEHRFELAISLKKLDAAYEIATQLDHPQKWRQLSDLALADWKLDVAVECLQKAEDLGGLLLYNAATADAVGLDKLAAKAGAWCLAGRADTVEYQRGTNARRNVWILVGVRMATSGERSAQYCVHRLLYARQDQGLHRPASPGAAVA